MRRHLNIPTHKGNRNPPNWFIVWLLYLSAATLNTRGNIHYFSHISRFIKIQSPYPVSPPALSLSQILTINIKHADDFTCCLNFPNPWSIHSLSSTFLCLPTDHYNFRVNLSELVSVLFLWLKKVTKPNQKVHIDSQQTFFSNRTGLFRATSLRYLKKRHEQARL